MSQSTGIEWTQATWNPWRGCTKVSPGCAHCYMFREQKRYGRDPAVITRSKTTFDDPLRWPTGRLIFTCSWSDWFHEAADDWRDDAWDIIRRTPQHTYQILTKRPERIAQHLPRDWGTGYPNVWLGVSVENQRHAYRAAALACIPAHVRFVSAEPLLGPVSLDSWMRDPETGIEVIPLYGLHWVIVGGESGPVRRAMDLKWARSLRDQCVGYSVPFFLKQLGGWPDKHGASKAVLDGARWTEMPVAYNAAWVTPWGRS